MQIRHLLLASLVSIAACGGGSKKAPAEPAPSTTEPAAPDPAPAATPPVADKAPEPAPAPPPAPKFALGEAKIVLKGAKKTEASGEITLAADGTLTATMTSSKKKTETKTVTGKLSADGELTDDKGAVIARIDADGKVETRHVSEEKEDGKMMKTETKYVEVGTLDETGTFTIKKDGKKMTIDDKGKLVGGPPDAALTVTSAPEQRKAAMFVIVAMFAASKTTMEMTGAKAGVPATPKK